MKKCIFSRRDAKRIRVTGVTSYVFHAWRNVKAVHGEDIKKKWM
jgi:hypothetical protein